MCSIRHKKMVLIVLLLGFTATQSGCGRLGYHAVRTLVTVAAVATVLAWHDSHFHSHHCGHEYVYVEERPVYHYQGRWEYYDAHNGPWYYYNERP